MTIMHMTLAELANSDPEMDSKDSKPFPVWYASGWISGESVITVYFSDGSIKHMSHDEVMKNYNYRTL